MRRLLLAIYIICIALCSFAQEEQTDSVVVTAEVCQTLPVGSRTPFWLAANRQGLSSIGPGYGYIKMGAVKKMDYDSKFSWGAGVDFAVPWVCTSDFVVQQLYAEVRYRSLSLSVGSRNQDSYLVDEELSSGDLLFSGNARPVPQVRAGIMDFQPLGFTNDWVSIKGYLSYGKFTDSSWQKRWAAPKSRYSKGALLCTRGLWLKGGDEERFPLVFEMGLDMATQFAGEIFNYDLYSAHKDTIDVKMPSGIGAWIKALIPLPGGKDTLAAEQTNAEGNTIGTYSFSLEWIPNSDWEIMAYWQRMFEDHSMMWIQFPWKDGLWGVQAWLPPNPFVSSVVYEYLYSKYQSGPVYNDTSSLLPEQVSGVDSYYNHGLYPGWMHWGMGIGNPFSISPIYNKDHILEFYATRNISHHLGIRGNPFDGLEWRMLVSNTRSWGSYFKPFPEVRSMWNFLAEVKWRPSKLKFLECNASLAFDTGDLVGKNFGIMLGVRCDVPCYMSK
ncbi:MAG: capsule assembly Wzi family protein [Muribaculum sp.]|nr:capsule assembly Wzi family protein [Muribaculum sp.]